MICFLVKAKHTFATQPKSDWLCSWTRVKAIVYAY